LLRSLKASAKAALKSAESEKRIQSTKGNKDFMRLGAKHIMVPNLDGVVETTWLTNDARCNIFLIGETHTNYSQCESM
jgi:hypothetical protein